jgi:phosphopantothenoylcysteine decarboxylase / phosphopantothenate---cysteine ligase
VDSALRGKTVLITSGPTRELLDPIRFMSNASSGRMGFSLARAAKRLGAKVVVVSGPTVLPDPEGVEVIHVTTALEMYAQVSRRCRGASLVIGAAAVSDWRFEKASKRKLKRGPSALRLTLLPNPDIIKAVARKRPSGRRQVVVGFALETHARLAHARRKLREKRLDAVVANGPSSLSGTRGEAVVLRADGTVRRLAPAGKDALARAILRELEDLF